VKVKWHVSDECILDENKFQPQDLEIHTHPFNGPFSGTTRVSRYQKGKTNLDFTEARDSEWQWRQLGHMQVCTSLQTDNHASTPPLSFFTGQMPFLPPNQQRQRQLQDLEMLVQKLLSYKMPFMTSQKKNRNSFVHQLPSDNSMVELA